VTGRFRYSIDCEGGRKGVLRSCRLKQVVGAAADIYDSEIDRIAGGDGAADQVPPVPRELCSIFPKRIPSYPQTATNVRQSACGAVDSRQHLTTEGKITGLLRKLTVGGADDQYEHEANRLAREVVNTSNVVAACSMQGAVSPKKEKDARPQTKPLAASITPFVPQRQC
jgi:hypothetical protein